LIGRFSGEQQGGKDLDVRELDVLISNFLKLLPAPSPLINLPARTQEQEGNSDKKKE
jgi:hypothetical protein